MNKKKLIIISISIFVVVMIIGVSYAMYGKSILGTKDTKVIAGDIYMRYINGETKEISMTPSDTYNEGDYYEFTISGKNTSNKDIIYDIVLNHGEELASPKIRLDDKYLRFRLVTVDNNVETLVDTANQYSDITNKKLYVGTIPNTNNYNVTYRLYVWVNGVIVGNVPNANYSETNWPNVYANLKVDVNGNFVEREADLSASKKVLKAAQLKGTTTGCTSAPLTWTDPEDNITYISGSKTCVDFNYLWYSGKMWRITAIYPDGAMKLVTDNMITSIAFNESASSDATKVNFYNSASDTSYMYQWLNEDFYDTLYNASNIIDAGKQWNATMPENTTISTKPGNTNLVTANVGLLNSYEYYNSYRCNGSSACSGSTYSTGYLNIGYYWWLLNPYNASSVRYVYSNGNASYISPSSLYGVRPSINLKSEISLQGSGTKNDPYMIVTDKSKGMPNELINTRLSGEYVKIKYQEEGTDKLSPLYRIVGVENNTVKIVMMDYLDNKATKPFATANSSGSGTIFGSGDTIDNTNKSTWYSYLNGSFTNAVSNKDGWFNSLPYKDTLTKGTYYMGNGDSASYYNYKGAICASSDLNKTTKECTKTSNTNTFDVGLLRYGEMFATQQGTGFNNSIDIWLITKYSSSYVRNVNNYGYGSYINSPTNAYGVRPSINLKSSIKIVLGSGTESDPYVVGL